MPFHKAYHMYYVLTEVVPHPDTVSMVPGAGSSVAEGRLTGWADGTLKSNGAVN